MLSTSKSYSIYIRYHGSGSHDLSWLHPLFHLHRSWEFGGNREEGSKSIPYQLQRLFLHLQVCTCTSLVYSVQYVFIGEFQQ